MRRYSILGTRIGEERESEIAQCDSNPQAVADAAAKQQVMLDAGGLRKVSTPKWRGVRIRDNVDNLSYSGDRWPDGNG